MEHLRLVVVVTKVMAMSDDESNGEGGGSNASKFTFIDGEFWCLVR